MHRDAVDGADRLFERLTSEWNSHLGVHDDTVARTGTNFHAVVHAQPPHLRTSRTSRPTGTSAVLQPRLMRWEPETIVHLPAGIGILPFMLPGSDDPDGRQRREPPRHRIVVWSKHGVMARSDISVTRAVDRIEYAEAAARYEYMDLVAGGRGEGLTVDEARAVVDAFDVETTLV